MRQRAILCSIDGMRPDGLQAAQTPTIDRLIAEGASTMQARTVMPSSTLPCHTAMLRGVDTPRHGITSNTFHPLARPVPSLFEAAKAAGKTTGMFYNWEQLRDLSDPGHLNYAVLTADAFSPEGDRYVAEQAVAHLRRFDFDFLFVYFGWTDECGHLNGWMSDPYIQAISDADACLGKVLDAVSELGRSKETSVLVLSDHGGHGRSHGTDSPEDMTIPWVLHGPGVRRGYTITGEVRIFDTCVTLAHLLNIPPAREWEGGVIAEALG